MDKYYWSFDSDAEMWIHSAESVDACLADAKEENTAGHETVYIAEGIPFNINGRIDVDIILEALEDLAYDYAGEAAEGWQPSRDVKYDKKVELEEAIAALVEEWLEKNGCTPTFCQLDNVQEYDLRKAAQHE